SGNFRGTLGPESSRACACPRKTPFAPRPRADIRTVKGLKETPSLDLASLPRSVTDEAEWYRGLLFYHRGSLRPATARERVNASPHDPTNRWRDKSSRSPALFQEAGACRAT